MKFFSKIVDPRYNLPELDNTPCKICGNVPPIIKIRRKFGRGKKKFFIDRSARVDCDASQGDAPSRNEVYCLRCWVKEIFRWKQ